MEQKQEKRAHFCKKCRHEIKHKNNKMFCSQKCKDTYIESVYKQKAIINTLKQQIKTNKKTIINLEMKLKNKQKKIEFLETTIKKQLQTNTYLIKSLSEIKYKNKVFGGEK
jgi:chromosome segregation ATPase